MLFGIKRYIKIVLILFYLSLLNCSSFFPLNDFLEYPEELVHIEKKVFHLINQYRSSNNLPQLEFNQVITNNARNHSLAMGTHSIFFGHAYFQKRISRIENLIHVIDASENVAKNQGFNDPAIVAFEAWLKSPIHLLNIEGKYNLTGIGVAKTNNDVYYITQIFVLAP